MTKTAYYLRVAAPKANKSYGRQPMGQKGNRFAFRDWKGALILKKDGSLASCLFLFKIKIKGIAKWKKF